MPLYTAAISDAAISANSQLVDYPNLFTANASSGPFLVFPGDLPPPWQFATPTNRPDLYQRLIALKQDNPACMTLGYIATGYALEPTPRETLDGILAQVDAWDVWNSTSAGVLLDGIMLDEYESEAFSLPFYRQVRDYIRAKWAARGIVSSLIRGNQGGPFVSEQHLAERCVDIASINESNFIPTADATGENTMIQRTFDGRYGKDRFNWLSHSRATGTWTDAQYRLIQKYCSTTLITDRTFGQNPWAAPPDSLQRQINLILTQPA